MERRYGRADRIWVGDRGMCLPTISPSSSRVADVTSSARQERAQAVRAGTTGGGLHTIRDGLEVSFVPHRTARRRLYSAAAAIAVKRKRQCTTV